MELRWEFQGKKCRVISVHSLNVESGHWNDYMYRSLVVVVVGPYAKSAVDPIRLPRAPKWGTPPICNITAKRIMRGTLYRSAPPPRKKRIK